MTCSGSTFRVCARWNGKRSRLWRKRSEVSWKARNFNVPHPFVGKIVHSLILVENGLVWSVMPGLFCPEQIQGKLQLLGLNKEDEDPYKSTNFVDDMTLWPPVSYGDIFCYFIDRPGVYTKQQLLQWRSLKAYNYYQVATYALWRSGSSKETLVSW